MNIPDEIVNQNFIFLIFKFKKKISILEEKILTEAIQHPLSTILMSFVNPADKFVILSRYWPVFFILHCTIATELPPLRDLKVKLKFTINITWKYWKV